MTDDEKEATPAVPWNDGLDVEAVNRLSYQMPIEAQLKPDGALALHIQRQRVIDMRVAGWSNFRIAMTLSIPEKEVAIHIKAALHNARRNINASVDHLKALENLRLDFLFEQLEDRAKSGDVEAVEVMLKISESRRKLLGLDRPSQQEMTIRHPEPMIYLPEVVEDEPPPPLEILPGDTVDGQ